MSALLEDYPPTASDVGAAPRPAGRDTPGPAPKPVGRLVVVVLPSRVLGSAGGADSTDNETMWAPRRMVKPNVRFSSVSTVWVVELDAPGAADFVCFRFMRRNSSVSPKTRFICYKTVSKGRRCDAHSTNLVECEHLPRHLATVCQSSLSVSAEGPHSSMRSLRDSHPVVNLATCQ